MSNTPLITQKMIEEFTKTFNESLSEMPFQEVVNLALTGYISKHIQKSYQLQNQLLLWDTEKNDHAQEVVDAGQKVT